MTVIYLDGVFLLNGIMDYLILLLTARLAGIPLRRRRYLWAALAGAGYAAAACHPDWGLLGSPSVKLAVGVLLALIAFGGNSRFLRLAFLIPVVSCALAGGVLGLSLLGRSGFLLNLKGAAVRLPLLACSAAVAYGVFAVVFRGAARHGLEGDLLPVRVCVQGRTVDLTALRDSGNALRAESGQPVLVLAPEEARQILPEGLGEELAREWLHHPAEAVKFLAERKPMLFPSLLPYCAVGCADGLLPTIRTDWIEVCGVRTERACAALSPTALGVGYGALWGGPVRKGGVYGFFGKSAAKDHGAAGIEAGGIRPLHRRKRYAAAASDPGAGGGAFEPDGGGRGPQGADRA